MTWPRYSLCTLKTEPRTDNFAWYSARSPVNIWRLCAQEEAVCRVQQRRCLTRLPFVGVAIKSNTPPFHFHSSYLRYNSRYSWSVYSQIYRDPWVTNFIVPLLRFWRIIIIMWANGDEDLDRGRKKGTLKQERGLIHGGESVPGL